MTASQKLQIRASSIRARLLAINGLEGDAYTDEIRSESDTLTTEFTDVETRLRAALVVEGDETEKRDRAYQTGETPEARELRELTGRANAGAIIMAVTEKRNCLGAELELQQAHGLAENQIPLDQCCAVEQRAAGVTTAPTNVGTSQAEIVQPVFSNGAGAFLGIDRPTVAASDAVYPVLATRPDVGGPHSDSSDVPETDSTFNADLLAPERIQASSMYRRVDAARFPNMDSALRMALNSGLEEKLDYEVLRGVRGSADRIEARQSQQVWRDDPRAVSLSVLLRPRRWALRRRAKRSQGADGKRVVRARGEHLSGHAAPERPGRADGEGSREGVGACARRGEHETKQRDPSRDAE